MDQNEAGKTARIRVGRTLKKTVGPIVVIYSAGAWLYEGRHKRRRSSKAVLFLIMNYLGDVPPKTPV